jgi:hypothetical protein
MNFGYTLIRVHYVLQNCLDDDSFEGIVCKRKGSAVANQFGSWAERYIGFDELSSLIVNDGLEALSENGAPKDEHTGAVRSRCDRA